MLIKHFKHKERVAFLIANLFFRYQEPKSNTKFYFQTHNDSIIIKQSANYRQVFITVKFDTLCVKYQNQMKGKYCTTKWKTGNINSFKCQEIKLQLAKLKKHNLKVCIWKR